MNSDALKLIYYQTSHQHDIDDMMKEIGSEFKEPIGLPKQNVPEYLKTLPNPYWVAMSSNKLAGTVGIAVMLNGYVALRRMFVKKEFRGKTISAVLLQQALNWAKENKATCMYLGTMAQFKAAQKFYEKHGFEKIPPSELPTDFPLNPIDSVFYKLKITI
jgi:GNAT superfamily N-acetyltransferase